MYFHACIYTHILSIIDRLPLNRERWQYHIARTSPVFTGPETSNGIRREGAIIRTAELAYFFTGYLINQTLLLAVVVSGNLGGANKKNPHIFLR